MRLTTVSVLVILTHSHTVTSICNDAIITDIYNQVTKSVQFVIDNYHQMDIDGVFTLVLAHGALSVSVPEMYQQKIRELMGRIRIAIDLIYPNIKSEGKLMYFKNYMIGLDLWTRPPTYGTYTLNAEPPVHPGPHEIRTTQGFRGYLNSQNFSDGISDQCLIELLWMSHDGKSHPCSASPACQDFMLSEINGYNTFWMAYGVTHRLLYLQIARARNCSIDPNVLRKYIEEDCSYIYWEMRMNQFYGFYKNYDDLFLEQVTFCGKEGFNEFFHRSFLSHTLDLAHPSGCFGVGISLDPPKRQKRGANYMLYGCNSHTTGLGISTLAIFLVNEMEKCYRG